MLAAAAGRITASYLPADWADRLTALTAHASYEDERKLNQLAALADPLPSSPAEWHKTLAAAVRKVISRELNPDERPAQE